MNELLDTESAEFERRTRELLERGAQQVPARIRTRLTQARHAAVGEHRDLEGRRAASWSRWLPAGAAAAVVLAVLIVESPRMGAELPRGNIGGNEDLEMLADSGAFALAQDQLSQDGEVDYEFYDWAVSTESDERGGTGS